MALPTDSGDKCKAIALMVIGTLLLIGGVAEAALCQVLVNTEVEFIEAQSDGSLVYASPGSTWWMGLFYIIPGVTTVVAGLTFSRAAHITNIVLTSINLAVNGVFVLVILTFGGLILSLGSSACDQGFDDDQRSSDLCNSVMALFGGIEAVICISWCLNLVSLILSGTKACCCASGPQPLNVVMSHTPGGGVTVVAQQQQQQMGNFAAGVPGPYAQPQGMQASPPPPYGYEQGEKQGF